VRPRSHARTRAQLVYDLALEELAQGGVGRRARCPRCRDHDEEVVLAVADDAAGRSSSQLPRNRSSWGKTRGVGLA
jgi:hypothetical protein